MCISKRFINRQSLPPHLFQAWIGLETFSSAAPPTPREWEWISNVTNAPFYVPLNGDSDFTGWAKGQPDNLYTGGETCSTQTLEGWNDYNCDLGLGLSGVLCEKFCEKPPLPAPAAKKKEGRTPENNEGTVEGTY